MPRTPRTKPRCLFAPILLAAASCGDAPPGPGSAPHVSSAPPLAPLVEFVAPSAERRERVLRVPDEITPWRVEGGQAELMPAAGEEPNSARKLIIKGKGPRALILPGPFPGSEVNRVDVRFQLQVRTRLRIAWWADGAPRLESSARTLASNAVQTVSAYFPAAQRNGALFDALRIEVPADTGSFVLHEIILSHEPLENWFPAPGSAATPMTVANDTREAVVVSAAVPVGGEFFATREHELRFSYSLPESLRGAQLAARLRVQLRNASGTTFDTEQPLTAGGWSSLRIPLLALAGPTPAPLTWRVSLAGEVPPGAALLIAEARLVKPRVNPRTVLLVTSDTHRGDHLGVAGEGVPVSTPALDRLAARGVLFERALSTTNITVPSHVALLTGFHPRDTGILDNATFLSSEAHTLAEAFQGAGYRTFAAVSAWHLSEPRSGIGQGFERLAGPSGIARNADRTVDQLEAWLGETPDEPVFAWLHVFDAHGPYLPPDEYANHEPVEGLAPDNAAALQIQAYRGEIGFLDAQLGRLFESPRLADAIVAVTADHGEVLGNHAIWFEHARLYMDTVHVPLILAWPEGPRGERVTPRVQHQGLGRTLLDLAGLASVAFPGQNLLAEGVADDATPRFALASHGESASITDGHWHLILNLVRHQAGNREREDTWRERHQVELYDLSRDPGCALDRHVNYHKVAAPLRRKLVDWLAATSDLGWARARELDAASMDQLRALGYTGEATQRSERWIDPDCDCEWCAPYR